MLGSAAKPSSWLINPGRYERLVCSRVAAAVAGCFYVRPRDAVRLGVSVDRL